MTDAVDQRYAPPEAHVEDVAVGGTGELATRWMRFWGATIDGLILGGVALAASRVVPPVAALYRESNGDVANIWAVRPVTAIVGFVLLLLVNGYLLVKRGQTVGKVICKTRIVRSDDSRVGGARLLVMRYGIGYLMQGLSVLGMLYGLIDSLLIFRDSHRCLHDTIADTKVIKL